MTVDGAPISASLFDFGLYFFHNARERCSSAGPGPTSTCRRWRATSRRGSGTTCSSSPRTRLEIPRGTIRATVLIETLPGRVRDGGDPLRAARARERPERRPLGLPLLAHQDAPAPADLVLPDRAQLTMTVPFMRAYTELLVKTCHRRGAHAMGGMAPFIPSRKDPEINEAALAKVREDKLREVERRLRRHLGRAPGSRARRRWRSSRRRSGRRPTRRSGCARRFGHRRRSSPTRACPAGRSPRPASATTSTWRSSTSTPGSLENGAAAIFNLMEDVATAEISRVAALAVDPQRREARRRARRPREELYRTDRATRSSPGSAGRPRARCREAAEILDGLVLTTSSPSS